MRACLRVYILLCSRFAKKNSNEFRRGHYLVWRLRLSGRVKVTCVAMVRVSKLLGSNINPNPNSNSALTLIMTLNSH